MAAVWETLTAETPSTEPIAPLAGKRKPNARIIDMSGEKLYRRSNSKPKQQKRLVLKNGLINADLRNVAEKRRHYCADAFTSLVDFRWRWTLFYFGMSYIVSWMVFAIIWWVILLAHSDIEHFDEPDWKPCVYGVNSFPSVFLFSLETQHTIGYGYHRMSDACPEAIALLCFQSITGVLIECLMVGVVLVKLSRPKKRTQTIIFSKNAVICLRDEQLYLMFRIADLRKSMLLESHVRAQVITNYVTAEGEVLPNHQQEIKVGGFKEDEDRIYLFWPTVIVHPIDEESPFYDMCASDLLGAKLEIIITMEGVVESTGMTTQAITSYLSSEIHWGHRFYNLTRFEEGRHIVDFEMFHFTYPVETPLCSAKTLQQIRDMKSEGISGHDIMCSLNGNPRQSGATSTTREDSDNDNDDDF